MKNWEVEAILKFYKDIDLDIKVTGEWLERYESVYDTTGAINYDGMPHGSNTSDLLCIAYIRIMVSVPYCPVLRIFLMVLLFLTVLSLFLFLSPLSILLSRVFISQYDTSDHFIPCNIYHLL